MITKTEKDERLDALRDLFHTYPHPASAERIGRYGNLTKYIPQGVFAQSCRNACITTEGGRCPAPADIFREALLLAPGQLNGGQKRSRPEWYRRAIALQKVARVKATGDEWWMQ
jgi:hypothetical protein